MSEMISSDLDESQESIFWCKKKSGFPPFGGRLAEPGSGWGLSQARGGEGEHLS